MDTPKTPLLGKTLYEIQQITANLGMPKFAAKQIASWLYDKKVSSIDEMTNLSLKFREALKEGYEVGASEPVEAMRSVDGTVKYLFRTPTNDFVEAVYIPDDDEEEVYQIVTDVRYDVSSGFVSKESPFGKAVLGKKLGDTCLVKVSEDFSYEVIIKSIEKMEDDDSAPLASY